MTKLTITAGRLLMMLGALAGSGMMAGCAFDAEPEAESLAALPGPVTQSAEEETLVYADLYDPIGYLDSINNNGIVFGWACDKDAPTALIQVDFWSADWSTFWGSAVANQGSEPAVNTSCGGGTAHRFSFQLHEKAFGESIMAWGLDVTAGAGMLIGSPRRWTKTVNLAPTDDTFVSYPDPTENYGDDHLLFIQSPIGGFAKRVYMKYDLNDIGTVLSANLHVTISTGMESLSVHRVDHTSWTESTLVWNNASIATIGHQTYPAASSGGHQYLDVTSQVNLTPSAASDADYVTFGIAQESTMPGVMASKESSTSEYHPYLTVTYVP